MTSVQTSLSTTTQFSTQTLASLVTSTTTQYSTQTQTAANASTTLTSLENAVDAGFAGTNLTAVQTAITGAIASATSTLATAADLATAQSGINSIMGSGFAAGTDDLTSIHDSLSAGFGGPRCQRCRPRSLGTSPPLLALSWAPSPRLRMLSWGLARALR